MSPTDLLLSEIDRILEESKTALLATIGPDGRARLRWMTPRRIKVRPTYLYCVSEAETQKVEHLRHNPQVTWSIQRATLNEVICVYGHAVVLDEPGLLQEFLEAVGKDLFMVWRLHPAQTAQTGSTGGARSPRPHLVVIETAIQEAERFDSLGGSTTRVRFGA
jgi:general stress protein 26